MNDAPPDDLAQRFTYHSPTPEQPEVYQLLRDAAYHLALLVQAAAKPSREQSLALTKVEEAVMHANSAIARHGLADPAYAGAADLHDQVLTQLATERPTSALIGADTEEHWHVESEGVPGAYSDASGPELARFYTALGLPENMGAGAYTIEMMGSSVIIRGLSLLTDVETYSAATRHAANPDEHEPPVARLYSQADLDAAREHGKHQALVALQRAATEPLREPLSRIGVMISGDASADYDEQPGRSEADPWADKPPYLMLELALRRVRDYLQARATGSHTHSVAQEAEYIDRVLANDLDGPEQPEQPEPSPTCGARPRGPGLRIPVGCDLAPGYHRQHHAAYDTGHDGWTTITWYGDDH